MNMPPIFFHADLDAFFASVEQLDNPEYRGKPVIVGGEKGKRGVVSTCSYEARKFGVHSAMPMVKAELLCPHAIFLRGHMARYQEKSREVMNIFSQWSPEVQQISVDEAFLDMTGTERLFGSADNTAKKIKAQIEKETGLTISIGIAANRYIAKIASGLSKPDGLVVVPQGTEKAFMELLPLHKVWGVGEKTRERLENAGLKTVPSLLCCSETLLQGLIGKAGGSFLFSVIRGNDPGIFVGEAASHSISSEKTFARDVEEQEVIETVILDLASDIQFRLLSEGLSGRTVHVKIRYSDFRTVSIQDTSDINIKDIDDLFQRALFLFRKKYEKQEAVRLIGIGVFGVTTEHNADQMDLFESSSLDKRRKVEKAVHSLAKKRGKNSLTRARLLNTGKEDIE